jgi:hypothetical protein
VIRIQIRKYLKSRVRIQKKSFRIYYTGAAYNSSPRNSALTPSVDILSWLNLSLASLGFQGDTSVDSKELPVPVYRHLPNKNHTSCVSCISPFLAFLLITSSVIVSSVNLDNLFYLNCTFVSTSLSF